jgi:hypothetical protein
MKHRTFLTYLLVGALLAGVWFALPDPLAFRPEDREAIRRGQERGREVAAAVGFPGWRPWESTVLLTRGRVNYLISPELSVQRLDPPEIPVIANGVARVKGQGVLVMAAKSDLETVLGGLAGEMDLAGGSGDKALIQGLLRTGQGRPLSDEEYLGVYLHEAFHLYQLDVLENWADRLPPQNQLWQSVYTDPANNALQDQEGTALLAAVRAPTPEGARAEARRFLAIRKERQARWQLDWELFYEWSEGLARYIQIKAGPAEPLIDQIGQPVDATFTRERVYRMGAGQALVLDRLLPGWQDRAARGEALLTLLAEALAQGSKVSIQMSRN